MTRFRNGRSRRRRLQAENRWGRITLKLHGRGGSGDTAPPKTRRIATGSKFGLQSHPAEADTGEERPTPNPAAKQSEGWQRRHALPRHTTAGI